MVASLTASQLASFERSVLSILEEIVARLPTGVVRLEQSRLGGRGIEFELRPSRPEATPLRVQVPNPFQVDVFVGRAGRFEVIARRRARGEMLDRVRQIIDAIVEGGFKEVTRERRGKILSSKSIVWFRDGSKLSSSAAQVFALPLLGERHSVTYQPYSPDGPTS
jgi:hypothetical protein